MAIQAQNNHQLYLWNPLSLLLVNISHCSTRYTVIFRLRVVYNYNEVHGNYFVILQYKLTLSSLMPMDLYTAYLCEVCIEMTLQSCSSEKHNNTADVLESTESIGISGCHSEPRGKHSTK